MMKRGKWLLGLVLAWMMALSLTAQAEMADGVICSDIISGIDHSSIVVEGDVTFFHSVMSDGSVVRFEGNGITIDAGGITLRPDSTITSLDAVGQIHYYQVSIQDGDQSPTSEQWVEIGYGYMNAADKTSVERASNIYASALMGWFVADWNRGGSLPINDLLPNFVLLKSSSGNTSDLTLTSLIIGYDPAEKYTDIALAMDALPGFFDDFDAFFADAADVPQAETASPAAITDTSNALLAGIQDAYPGALCSDVIAGIEPSTVLVDGDTTTFCALMADGRMLLFEGQNITVTEEGITLYPGSTITSLDALGQIAVYYASIRDGDTAPISEQWLDVGYGYTLLPDMSNVASSSEVFTEMHDSLSAATLAQGESISVADALPNFLFVRAAPGNTEAFILTSMIVVYDPLTTFTAVADVQEALPASFYAEMEAAAASMDLDLPLIAASIIPATGDTALPADQGQHMPAYEVSNAGMDESTFTAMKMAEPGTLTCDVIAGLDRSSIVVQGDSTYFSAVMADGSVVRFEGTNITITEDGILMAAGSTITSLDAVGKIYEYAADILNKNEAPICDQWLEVGYGYTFSAEKTSVGRASDVYTSSLLALPTMHWTNTVSIAFYQPNFIHLKASTYNTEAFTLTSLTIGYDPADKVTALTDATLYAASYGEYIDGAAYNIAKETMADPAGNEYTFYLKLKTQAADEAGITNDEGWLNFLPSTFYTAGDLKDADGIVQDKATARVHAGYTLDVIIGDYTLTLSLPVAELYTQPQTMKEARPYGTQTAVGEQYALVIPIVWADQTDLASDELYALYQKALGAVIDEQGNLIGDFSDPEDEVFSLTEYFTTASYGQLTLSSFMTDWYYTDKLFANDYEFTFPEIDFASEVLSWVKAAYPDTDWSVFDQDADGIIDSVVLLSVGLTDETSFMPASFGGAVHCIGNNYGSLVGEVGDPVVNNFLTISHFFLKDGETDTLIHEYSHNFGLYDYYDTTYSNIDAVGKYDMQSGNVGDWNAYSKLVVGWMEPQIVSGLASGESMELTIGSSALVGDVILLPAAGTEYTTPFSEYVMIDLLTPDGVNAYDAADYGLQNTIGVRISHVNANMKASTEQDTLFAGFIEDNGNVIGVELYNNNYDAALGVYNIEVIQAGRKNTFTDPAYYAPNLSAADLFYAGDTFTAEAYSQFFYNGLMDNGMALGYSVKILSIGTDAEGNPTATIRITAD